MVPVNKWALAKEGSIQVDVVGLDDKKEMIVLLGVSATGHVLLLQRMQAGKNTTLSSNC